MEEKFKISVRYATKFPYAKRHENRLVFNSETYDTFTKNEGEKLIKYTVKYHTVFLKESDFTLEKI